MADKNFKIKTGLSLPQPLPADQGGTGQNSLNNALNAMLPSQAGNTGKVLASDGTSTTWATLPTGYTKGSTASRPNPASAGDLYFNTDYSYFESYTVNGWFPIAAAPTTPTSVVATDTPSGRAYNNGRASVAFSIGANGGSPTSLVVTPTPTTSPATFSGNTSPIIVTGLTSSQSYTYTVSATSPYGTSAASSASSAVTATTVPQAPTIGVATGGNGFATVTYTPGATGGAAATYTATSNPDGLTGTGTSPITVNGLTNGTAYTFSVAATNANGTSVSSASTNSITPSIPTGDWESIQTITSSSSFASADFTSIPQTFKHLQVRCIMGGSANAFDTNYMFYTLNGDNSANYYTNRYGVTNSAAGSSVSTGQNQVMPALASYENGASIQYMYGALILDLYDYTNTNKRPVAMSMGGGNLNGTSGYYNTAMEGVGMLNTGNAAVSRITVFHQTGNLKPNSKIALYGMKG